MAAPDPSVSAAGSPLRVALTGASGLIGRHVAAALRQAGHRVDPLVRRAPQTGTTEIRWDPARGDVDAQALWGVDAVVHLAGESIAAGRWTPARKTAIRDSRVLGTMLLAQCLAQLDPPPRVFVSASAIGYYGDRGDEPLDEGSPPGRGFLADVCREWEAATAPARQAGIRVVNLRIGMVLSRDGGALPRMLTPFKLGLGGRVGNGRQWMSWIALPDLVRVFEHVIATDELRGPVNGVAPQPVTNAEFTRALGRVLRRPTILPAPAFAVRLVFGEMGQELLLASTRVLPGKLQASGFAFELGQLETALRAILRCPGV